MLRAVCMPVRHARSSTAHSIQMRPNGSVSHVHLRPQCVLGSCHIRAASCSLSLQVAEWIGKRLMQPYNCKFVPMPQDVQLLDELQTQQPFNMDPQISAMGMFDHDADHGLLVRRPGATADGGAAVAAALNGAQDAVAAAAEARAAAGSVLDGSESEGTESEGDGDVVHTAGGRDAQPADASGAAASDRAAGAVGAGARADMSAAAAAKGAADADAADAADAQAEGCAYLAMLD